MSGRRLLTSVLFAQSVAALALTLAAFQASGPVAGPRLLGRLAGALIEVDRWLPAHRQDIEAAARERPRQSVPVAGLPAEIAVPYAAALAVEGDVLEKEVLRALGLALYERGASAFGGSIAFREPARWTVELLRRTAWRAWRAALLGAALATAVTGVVVAATSPAPRAPALLRLLAAGGGLAAALSSGAWLLARAAAGGANTMVSEEVALIARDCAWIGVRDGLAIGGAALFLLLVWALASQPTPRAQPWAEAVDEGR